MLQTSESLNSFERRPSTKATSPFRYPGGKGFLTHLLKQKIQLLEGTSRVYAEPFCGGAGAATNLLLDGVVESIYLNDLDPCVYSAWKAIVFETDRFIEKLKTSPVTVDEWKNQRHFLTRHKVGYDFDVGFATFFLNRTSRAGIILGSGPIGGYGQTGVWKIDARFYKDTMIKRIRQIGERRKQITVCNQSAESFIEYLENNIDNQNTFIFIDPPYFEIGTRLYLNGMGEHGHRNLANKLKGRLRSSWMMTYDNHPEIRRLYDGFSITELEVLYSLQRKRKVSEIVIQAAAA